MKNILFQHILDVERNFIALIKRFSRYLEITVFLTHKRKAIFMKNNFLFPDVQFLQVYNFLPSVSAAIGHYRPQRDVWKTAIALQAIVRTLVFMMYYRYYKEHVYIWARYLSNVALVMYAIENTSLVTLSFWTSDENYSM